MVNTTMHHGPKPKIIPLSHGKMIPGFVIQNLLLFFIEKHSVWLTIVMLLLEIWLVSKKMGRGWPNNSRQNDFPCSEGALLFSERHTLLRLKAFIPCRKGQCAPPERNGHKSIWLTVTRVPFSFPLFEGGYAGQSSAKPCQ